LAALVVQAVANRHRGDCQQSFRFADRHTIAVSILKFFQGYKTKMATKINVNIPVTDRVIVFRSTGDQDLRVGEGTPVVSSGSMRIPDDGDQ
jgi:hypothetical protein